jgi:iron complex transport system ATP-binding protein
MIAPPLSFASVTVRYRDANRDALTDVSLTADAGRLTAVVGPNGSGKSTLVRALLRRVPLRAGRIAVGDESATALAPRVLAARVAVVPQREELVFPTTVREYVALGRFPHIGTWSTIGAADRVVIDAAVERTGVAPFLDRRVDALSGGEWQRVRLARALAQGAPVLVLDEPTTFLDIAHEMVVFELLAALAAEGRTVLLVSHQLNLVARFADRIVLLHAGSVAASGAPDDVMRAPILEHVYQWPLVVARDPAVGSPTLVPLRSASSTSATQSASLSSPPPTT